MRTPANRDSGDILAVGPGARHYAPMTIPACCTAPRPHWPFPVALPGVALFSARFDPAQLDPDDFHSCAIAAPASIQRSVAKRQTEYLAGRLCARSALAHIEAPAIAPGLGEDRAPLWPAAVTGSITHTDGWAAAVVAPGSQWRGLGLDAEPLLQPARAERLASGVLTAAELLRLQSVAPAQRALLITLTFSIKESLFKALYPLVLKRFYFEHAEVIDWQDAGQVRLRLLTDLSQEFGVGAEFVGQYCVERDRLLSLVHL